MTDYYFEFAEEFPFPEKEAKEVIAIIDGKGVPDWWLEKHIEDKEKLAEIKNSLNSKKPVSNSDEQSSGNIYKEWLEAKFELDGDLAIEYSYDNNLLYLTSQEEQDIEFIAMVLSDVMEYHNTQQIITLTGARTCSKACPSDFGGVAIAIAPGDVEFMDTWYMKNQLGAELAKKYGIKFDSGIEALEEKSNLSPEL